MVANFCTLPGFGLGYEGLLLFFELVRRQTVGAAGHSIAAPVTRPDMPSLLYIARITRFSEELAEELRSSGFHVKAFGPGEITADECWLVMTSEAVLASLQPTNSASA